MSTKATKATTAAASAIDYAEGGRLAERWLRLAREHDEIRVRNPADPNIAFGRRGELTVERDRALAELRAWIDPTIDAEQAAERGRREAEERARIEAEARALEGRTA